MRVSPYRDQTHKSAIGEPRDHAEEIERWKLLWAYEDIGLISHILQHGTLPAPRWFCDALAMIYAETGFEGSAA